jgi:hypothetical protein
MDWNISDKSRLMGRYTYFATDIDTPSVFGTVAGGPPLGGLVNAGVSTSLAQNVAVTYNHTFSPSLLATGRFGFSRLKLTDFAADSDLQTTSAVGIPGVNGVGNPDYTNGLSTMAIPGLQGAFGMARLSDTLLRTRPFLTAQAPRDQNLREPHDEIWSRHQEGLLLSARMPKVSDLSTMGNL